MGFVSIVSAQRGPNAVTALEVSNPDLWERHIYAWKEYDGVGTNFAADIEVTFGTDPPVILDICASSDRNVCDRDNKAPQPSPPNEVICIRFDPAQSCGTATTPAIQHISNFTELFTTTLTNVKISHWKAKINDHQSVRIVIMIENDNSGDDGINSVAVKDGETESKEMEDNMIDSTTGDETTENKSYDVNA